MDIESIANWNPWWNTKEVPETFKGIKRTVDPLIFESLKEREIIALTGIRRCGKTTLMYQMIDMLLKTYSPSQILYVNLDDEALNKNGLEEIYSMYRQNKNPDKQAFVFLDEIQNIEKWERFLKKYYDMKDNVKFVISGSSANLLRGEYATLLSGRNLTFNISPLSFKEFLDFSNIEYKGATEQARNKILNELNKYLEYGGFPEVHFKNEDLKIMLLRQYFDDIVYKDIVKRHNVNAKKITDLAIYLLTNISNVFTIRKIRDFTGLSIDSIKDYISYLDEAFLIIPINHFAYSLKEISLLQRKSYASDCGLRNIVGLRFSSDAGRLAENCVCIELKKRKQDIYYWKGNNEVDFIVKEKDSSLTAINVSYTDKIEDREMKGLEEFKTKFAKTKKRIILTRNTEKEENGIIFIPLWKWLLAK